MIAHIEDWHVGLLCAIVATAGAALGLCVQDVRRRWVAAMTRREVDHG